ncbi:MAG: hypothetical protein ABFS43_06195 [Thermodesulfobacteriota bacterium]
MKDVPIITIEMLIKQYDVLVVADEMGFPFLETIEAVFSAICRAVDEGRRVHLILPNPDLIYPKVCRMCPPTCGQRIGSFRSEKPPDFDFLPYLM